jgi:hypothetical protein
MVSSEVQAKQLYRRVNITAGVCSSFRLSRRANDKASAAFFSICHSSLQLINEQSVSELLLISFLQMVSKVAKRLGKQQRSATHSLSMRVRLSWQHC